LLVAIVGPRVVQLDLENVLLPFGIRLLGFDLLNANWFYTRVGSQDGNVK